MSAFITHLLDRLPEFGDRLREALETNSGLEEAARAHHEVCDEIESGRVDEPGEVERLKHRRALLEEEIVRMLGAGGRV
ncbi:MAG: hypothetical protein NXI21_13260 [Alphaproteobacteria bacterium]|nr:hypothetical protein [Alphaproteobacteria bacterium]